MTAPTRDDAVRTLREASLTAEALAWTYTLLGYRALADRYDGEADRLWARADALATAEVRSC